jgi:para-nitrobenzyl esterase
LDADQEALAATMRTLWANFAATGNPSSSALSWPPAEPDDLVLSLESPQPQIEHDFASVHNCAFWAAG